MKAVRIIGYEQAVYTDVPVPIPASDELLVQVKRVGVCHSDVEVFRQELGIYRSGGASLPITVGHEWAGEVVQVGARVQGFETGEVNAVSAVVTVRSAERDCTIFARTGWR
jgi:D-arabinose 1-dehydrogenase-like Zn-dependent alcohol dehydrogenase